MFVHLIVLTTLSVIPQFLAEESILNDVSLDKRAMGFQGMRGKKDIISSLDDNELLKRAPIGFHGMRGKKDDYLTSDFDGEFYNDDYEKRAPMGFQGMRGKKAMLQDDLYKRAIMGFQGMRGKRTFDEILDEIEKRAELHGMSNRLYMNEYPDEYEKRAVAMGFQGMRGKKNYLTELEDLEKRAIMGFQGMRGKKDEIDNYYEYIVDPIDYEKRAPMGFQGMRGKKEGDKRGNMGFVGMRGKRNVMGIYDINDGYHERPQDLQDPRFINDAMHYNKRASYGSFGTRGKKIPRWEIRGKFVGVRGKKWSPNLDNADNLMINRFGSADLIDLKTDSTPKFNTQ